MIYIIQLVYLVPGQEAVFEEFESMAIPIISKYNGKLLLRIRPDEKTYIASEMEKPYEIHFVEFPEQQDFENFKMDEERKTFLHLKDMAIRSSVLIQGTQL
jgi:uncharacterized protein (DUF1330 family)